MIEADFQRFYGLDLREAVAEEGPRRILALINGLPFAAAATWREEQPKWTHQDEWMANVLEAVDAWGHRLIEALLQGKTTVPGPLEIKCPDRPEAAPAKPKKERRLATPGDVAALMR